MTKSMRVKIYLLEFDSKYSMYAVRFLRLVVNFFLAEIKLFAMMSQLSLLCLFRHASMPTTSTLTMLANRTKLYAFKLICLD